MKTAGNNIAKQINRALVSAFVFLVVGGLLLFTQRTNAQNVTDEKRRELINKQVKERKDAFYKVSSTDVPTDPGNRIVAIRRISFTFDDLDSKRKIFRNQKDLIEVEVFSKVPFPVTNATQYLIIGDKVFAELDRSGDNQTVFVHLKPEEFAQIKDGAIISYIIGPADLNSDLLKKQYKEGEPKQISGAKFGRINKTLINQFGVIEEDNDAQNLRISKTVNQVQ